MTTNSDVLDLPVWPGEHPGTGFNDHPHVFEAYRAQVIGGAWVRIEACQICGLRRR